MLRNKLLGVPLVVWGGICLGVALLWTLVWPSDRIAVASGLRFMILRWLHALTWLLLAGAAFLAAFSGPAKAKPIALLALAVYLVFMATLIVSNV